MSDRASITEGHQLVLVTGPSGAGRSTAINALEDLGYEVIDNLPLSLVPRLVDGAPVGPIALGLDVRNRDFAATALIELIDRLTRRPEVSLDVLYLDCSADELIRRYNQTRRRHPLGLEPAEAIAREVDLLAPVRVRADNLIDTTDMSPHDLKAEIARWYDRDDASRMSVAVQSFSYKRGVPRGVDMIFDCRFLSNPHWVPALRELDGRDAAVVEHIRQDPNFEEFFTRVRDLVLFLMPAQQKEGKAHLTIGFGCTGGQHRSVALVEMLAYVLAQQGWPVSKRHRELERRVAVTLPTQAG
ncbi:RNase adapter RapZ [Falsirhodobacter sp. 20TX0035]|uniref:RNase adapter RapZ n=1 Tax=Falsirhodobacter sp. 20TX0035 TaxID=3022019 RepID=UPI00232AFDE0|nr:RNase adapter RapZ [Falsirhodobacter sp. 20TX0035]MDB6454602.1 RNase adapter RapZ [Falsirhodobacter sp. 20TX0035]